VLVGRPQASELPYAEGLPDRQAADAVRSRIDWKYALNLELTDPGFDHTVLSEFRARLIIGSAEQLLLDTFLQRCRERKFLKTRGRQRTDSTHVLAAIRVSSFFKGGVTKSTKARVLAAESLASG
jgi:transposase